MLDFDAFVNAILSAEMPRSQNRRRGPSTIRMDPDVFLTYLRDPDSFLTFGEFLLMDDVPHATAYLRARPRVCRDIIKRFSDPTVRLHYGIVFDRTRIQMVEAATDHGERLRTYVLNFKSAGKRSIENMKSDIFDLWSEFIMEITEEGFMNYGETDYVAYQAFMNFAN
jgi:hypothetical protein